MKPYQPRASNPSLQEALNARYAALGVTEEIVLEPKGFILKMYVMGEYIGGEQQLPAALDRLAKQNNQR